MKKTKGMLIASAAASLILAGAIGVQAAEDHKAGGEKILCEGINACKGQGACATAHNSCAGKNACKGQGAVEMTPEDCKAKGGKVGQKAP
jgi:uncharacterized membrane protein